MTKLDAGFTKMKEAKDSYLLAYGQIKGMSNLLEGFVIRIKNVEKSQRMRNSQLFLNNLKEIYVRTRSENSKREILRINSKIDRELDDF